MIRIVILITLLPLFSSGQNAGLKQTWKHPSGTWTIEWSPDGNYIAFGGDDSVLTILNASDFSVVHTHRLDHMIKGMSWHPFEQRLALALFNGVKIFDVGTRSLSSIASITTGGRAIGWNHTGELLALADGRGEIKLISKNGTILRTIKKHNNHSYLSLHWHPSRDIMVTGSDEIILFDTSGRQIRMIQHREQHTGVLTVQWHPSGKFFASGDYGHEGEGVPTLLQFWSESGELLKTMKGSKAEYRNIRWNRSGTRLATASDGLRVWDDKGNPVHTGATDYLLWGISWNREGKQIITASFEGNIDLWTEKASLVKHFGTK